MWIFPCYIWIVLFHLGIKMQYIIKQEITTRDFPGGPVVKIPHFHCRGCGSDPWLGN